MRTNRGVLVTIVVYAIAMGVAIAGFFLLEVDKTKLNYWALGGLLFSLAASMVIIAFFVFRSGDRERTFASAGLISAIVIYQIAVIVSIVFTGAFRNNPNRFILLEIVINAAFFVVVIAVIAAAGRIHDRNAMTYEKQQSGEYDSPKRGGF